MLAARHGSSPHLQGWSGRHLVLHWLRDSCMLQAGTVASACKAAGCGCLTGSSPATSGAGACRSAAHVGAAVLGPYGGTPLLRLLCAVLGAFLTSGCPRLLHPHVPAVSTTKVCAAASTAGGPACPMKPGGRCARQLDPSIACSQTRCSQASHKQQAAFESLSKNLKGTMRYECHGSWGHVVREAGSKGGI